MRQTGLFIIAVTMTFFASSRGVELPGLLFDVGIVRGDGILVPVARYDSSKWSTILDLPEVWSRHIDSRPWWVYDTDPQPKQLQLGTFVRFDPGNHSGSGYVSSYTALKGFKPSDYHAVAFAATSESLAVTHFRSCSITEARKEFRLVIDSVFATKEGKYVSTLPDDQGFYPTDKSVRSEIPLQYDLYIAALDYPGKTFEIAYFDASRWYPHKDCGPIARLSGWLVFDGVELIMDKVMFETDDCDGKMLSSSFQPYVFFSLDDRSYILSAVFGWESDSFQIFEYAKSRLIPQLSFE